MSTWQPPAVPVLGFFAEPSNDCRFDGSVSQVLSNTDGRARVKSMLS